ncbi:MAG: NYN domain-containing protein, partial [Nanoarchaeota archaeon]
MPTKIYKQQRVGVFVDVQNMYYSAKNLYKAKVNFKAVLNEAGRGRNLIRAIAYVVEAQELKEKSFFEALLNIGFEVKAKELQVFYGGMKKGDWDIGI